MVDIKIKDADGVYRTYEGVSEVELDTTTEGETAVFKNAPDLEEKTVTVTENGTTEITPSTGKDGISKIELTVNVSGGGAGEVDSGVIFIDYDGTIIESWKSADVAGKTALPDNPTHERLVAQGWNWSLADIQDYIADYPEAVVVVGQMYKTASGITEFDISLNKATGKTITLKDSSLKDWGDGTSNTAQTHTYENYGNYTISCNTSYLNESHVTPTSALVAAFLGETINSIGQYSLRYHHSMKYLTIPNKNYSSIEAGYLIQECYALSSLILPPNVPLGAYVGPSYFEFLSLSPTSELKGSSCLSLWCLKHITIPTNTAKIDFNTFYNCCSLKKLIVPSSVTTIENSAFNNAGNILLYDFSKASSVPSLRNNAAFTGINEQAKIIVPDALYNSWIAATNWSSRANYIYKASEVTD